MTNKLVAIQTSVDLTEFRLVSEPTLEAIEGDIEKFVEIAKRGMDMTRLGGFLAGVSIIKAEHLINPARRGRNGKAGTEEGIMAWRRKRFPHISNQTISNWKNFATSLFETIAKNQTVGILENSAPLSFQLPENPDDLMALNEAIVEICDGRTLREIYAANGRAIEPAALGGDTRAIDPATGEPINHKARRTAEDIARQEYEDASSACCLHLARQLRRYLSISGPKEEPACAILSDQELEQLKGNIYDAYQSIKTYAARRPAMVRAEVARLSLGEEL